MAARTLINLPRRAARGEVVSIRTLIQHPMESGYRPNAAGEVVPRDILRRFSCRYDGAEVFSAEFSPAIAANPFLSFTFRATASGTVELRWDGDNGFTQTETRQIEVT
jgi:sulfur-oxidizing protein SoxZ